MTTAALGPSTDPVYATRGSTRDHTARDRRSPLPPTPHDTRHLVHFLHPSPTRPWAGPTHPVESIAPPILASCPPIRVPLPRLVFRHSPHILSRTSSIVSQYAARMIDDPPVVVCILYATPNETTYADWYVQHETPSIDSEPFSELLLSRVLVYRRS